MIREEILQFFPEINKINDEVLRKSCVDTWIAASNEVGHTAESLRKLIFVGKKLKNCPIDLITHTQQVVGTAVDLAKRFNAAYGPAILADMDIVIASAILHDVGKAYENPPSENQEIKAKTMFMRHPYTGSIFAEKCGCPWKVVYIIANHSFEGDKSLDMPEFFIVKKADWLNFEYLFFAYPRV